MSLRMTRKAAQRLTGRRGGAGAGYPVRSKFNARRTTVDGWTFASRKEAQRYQQLLIRGRLGEIRNLELQPRFDLHAATGARIGAYVADFRYDELVSLACESTDGLPIVAVRDVIEDVKGMKTPVYRLKKKLVEAEYGFTIQEI